MVNEVRLIGRLGNDPTSYQDGKIVKARLVTWNKWKDKTSGDWMEKNQWHNIISFGKATERLSKCKKGELIIFTGSIEYSEYDDKDGIKRISTEIKGFPIRFPKPKTDQTNTVPEQPKPDTPDENDQDGVEDDLPF